MLDGPEENKEAQQNATTEDQSQVVKYNWENKWLKGDEYYHILTHAELYIKTFNFGKYPPKTHPPTTYSNPISTLLCKSVDGDMYFVEGLTVGSEFGFPRTEIKKKYKWSVLQLIIGRR